MSLANILVHVDSSPRAAARLGLCLRLAERTGARVTGLFAELAEAHHVGVVSVWPSERYKAAVAAARAAFTAATKALGERATFIDANRGGESEILARVTDVARTFDLDIGARVIFAWRRSRGAARALADARFILAKDCEALVMEIAGPSERRDEF